MQISKLGTSVDTSDDAEFDSFRAEPTWPSSCEL